MKIRSILLVACIVVVPLIAMFSHRVPPAARAAVGEFLRDVVRGGKAVPRATAAAPVAQTVTAPGSAQPAPGSAQIAPGSAQPTPVAPPPEAAAHVVPVAAVAPAADSGDALLQRLRSLGAVAIDCRPLPGPGGYVASCRVAVDGAGQLERLFQATGASAAAAAENLHRDVVAWRNGSPGGPPRTMRF